MVVNRELRQDTGDGGSTKHIEIDIQGTGLSYLTADNLSVLPECSEKEVEGVANQFGFDLDGWFKLVPRDSSKQDKAGWWGHCYCYLVAVVVTLCDFYADKLVATAG